MSVLTITTTGAQDTRIIDAYRATSGNPAATAADVKAWLIQQLKRMVHSYETQQAAVVAADGVVQMDDPT